jgi:Putative MetA-pathway of phenol degradation
MRNRLLLVFLFWGIIIGHVLAQGTIQLDRPDQTECPFIVPQNYVQFESGFALENINSSTKSYNYPSILWKYGLNERFELRLITEQVSQKIENKTVSGLMPITIGFKTNICQEKGIIPITSFIGHLTTAKTGNKAFHTASIAPSFRFVMQHTLNDKISLAYNLGAEWNGETTEQTSIYTLTTGISLTQRLGTYVELYGFIPKNSAADHRFDCGLTYLMNKNLMIDLSGGIGLSKNAPKNYVAFGISYRFDTASKTPTKQFKN